MVSNRFAVALQLGLSLAVTAAASLSLGWDNPKWALFAVAFCVLGTGGESLMKGTWRLLGTMLGVIAALIMLALFVQARWAYMAGVMAWLGLCSWMMTGHRNWYMWMIAGFMVPLMGYYSQGDPERAFQDVVLRLQQTSLGVICYMLVCTFVFPRHVAKRFVGDVIGKITDLRTRFEALGKAFGAAPAIPLGVAEPPQRQSQTKQSHLLTLDALDAAALESVAILGDRDRWLRLLDELRALSDGLTRWRLGFADIVAYTAGQGRETLPDVSPVVDEVLRRLDSAVAILEDDVQVCQLRPVRIPMPESWPKDPLQEGALRVSLQTLGDIETASARLLLIAADIKNLAPKRNPDAAQALSPDIAAPRATLMGLPKSIIPDPDRLTAVLRITTAFMAAFLVVIYTPELPAAGMVVILIGSTGLFITRTPSTSVPPTYVIGVLAIFGSGILHIFVMPKLSGFFGLAVMLFLYAFFIGYVFYKPTQIVIRFMAVGFLTMIIQLDDSHQQYSFVYVANLAVAFSFPMLILHFLTRFPVSFHPEHVFDRLFRRYLRSAVALVDEYARYDAGQPTWWQQQKHRYHLRQLMRLPGMMEQWIAHIAPDVTQGDTTRILHDLLDALDALAHRLDGLTQHHDWSTNRDALAAIIRPELNEWCNNIKHATQHLIDDPHKLSMDDLTQRLGDRIERLRAATGQALATSGGHVSDPKCLGHVGELAIFRGVSRALLNIVGSTQAINWPRMREARF